MSVAASAAFQRPPDIDGVPSVEWVMARYRREWQGAKYDRQRVAAFVLRHGVEAVLHGDIVDLEDLDHVGKEFCGRRLRARRAQKILQDFHGVPR